MSFSTIVTEGNLIPADLLEQITTGSLLGQQPTDFWLDKTARLTDEIALVWSEVRDYWKAYQHRLRRLSGSDPATRQTREYWIGPLLESLGYKLTYMPSATMVNNQTYAISHRAGEDENGPPVHIEGIRRKLDERSASGKPRLSPHALIQEYLNNTEHLWGIVTNGEKFRLLRDSSRTSRPTYVEFDLKAMLEGEKFSEFALFYRLLHRSRLPQGMEDTTGCWLEKYHQQAIEAGGRVRDGLRDGVEVALVTLGQDLLAHPANSTLSQKLKDGKLKPLDYYRQLLRLVYRLLFLMVAEERNLIQATSEESLKIYRDYYSINRLRRLADQRGTGQNRFGDLWLGLHTTFRLLEDDGGAEVLGLTALDGDLFGPQAIPDLQQTRLLNETLLKAIRALSVYLDPQSKMRQRVNYAALDVEELGSVYESLLDFRPVVSTDNLTNTLNFALVTGTERKTTGSYYTRPELVHELIVSALEPVLNERLVAAGTDKAAKEQAILEITVCDPACGSGHFLLAAARRLGKELARVRSGEDQPGPEKFREAVREVISRSIYGVDLNPLAVDLCKLALWIEGYNAGMPHSFLDSHIRWGNSLIGATRALVKAGIPDEAFQAVTGDVKAVATAFKKRNQQERKLYQDTSHVQSGLNFEAEGEPESRYKALVEQAKQVEALPDKNMAQVRRKTEEFSRSRSQGTVWWDELTTLHLWTAAFFTPLTSITNRAIPTSSAIFDPLQRRGDLVSRGYQLAAETGFFHWELEFPQVFERGGFDVVLGNPPWESMQLEELQFFASRDLGIAKAQNKAAREKLIKLLPQIKPHLAEEFAKAQYMQEATNRYVRNSKRFPLAAVGKMNTYALFAEHSCNLVNPQGRAGIIVPTGIATDDTTKAFFGDLNEQRSLASMYDFENREALFAGVHRSYKFSLLTIGKTTGPTKFVFFASNTRQLNDAQRKFTLTPEEIALLNPNTRTCPVFRTNTDAELTKKIYRLNPVLINEKNGRNDWGISFMQGLFNMSTDSYLFKNNPSEGLVPLYEAKLIHQFTHRWATYYGQECREFTCKELQAPNSTVTPRYWVESTLVEEQLAKRWSKQWLLGFRNVCRSTDERTAIFSLLPKFGVGHSMPLIFINPKITSSLILCLLALFNSFPFDYVVRQKIGGVNLTFGYVKQLPSLPPAAFSKEDVVYITERVLELVYTASDMQPFAVDVWAELDETGRERVWLRWLECNGAPLKIQNLKSEIEAPFIWNEARRAQIRAELDAKIAGLYGLTRDELRYILDPAEVYGPDFPGETFRVLKEKETKLYGEYRTRRLVLEAWDKN